MTDQGFFRTFIFGSAGLYATALLFILLADPYNVSPVQIEISRFNRYTPASVDVDRHTKPLMVWLTKPKTVFLGTSRIHQSIDPAELDDTVYAPAYNGSIPASDLGLNRSHLEYYRMLDPQLQNVFAEIFIYNFLGQVPTLTERNFIDLIKDCVSLFASADAFRSSFQTVIHNIVRGSSVLQVNRRGFLEYTPDHAAGATFAGFPKSIWSLHEGMAKASPGNRLALYPPAFEVLRDLVRIAKAQGNELHFILTPMHSYLMYYFYVSGEFDLLYLWLEQMTQIAPVISFSQPNEITYEEVRSYMRYWNDPLHFSINVGRMMQASLIGRPLPETPANFMFLLTPDNIKNYLETQRAAILAWAQEHPDFVAEMKKARPAPFSSQRLIPKTRH